MMKHWHSKISSGCGVAPLPVRQIKSYRDLLLKLVMPSCWSLEVLEGATPTKMMHPKKGFIHFPVFPGADEKLTTLIESFKPSLTPKDGSLHWGGNVVWWAFDRVLQTDGQKEGRGTWFRRCFVVNVLWPNRMTFFFFPSLQPPEILKGDIRGSDQLTLLMWLISSGGPTCWCIWCLGWFRMGKMTKWWVIVKDWVSLEIEQVDDDDDDDDDGGLYQDEIRSGAGIRLQNRSLDDPDGRTLRKTLLAWGGERCFFSRRISSLHPKTRLQICPRKTFSETIRHRWYQAGSKYWFLGFGFHSGPNLQPWKSLVAHVKPPSLFQNFETSTGKSQIW